MQAALSNTGENRLVVHLPVHLGRCVSRVRVEDIAPEVDVTLLVAAILLDMEQKVVVLRATRTPHRNW